MYALSAHKCQGLQLRHKSTISRRRGCYTGAPLFGKIPYMQHWQCRHCFSLRGVNFVVLGTDYDMGPELHATSRRSKPLQSDSIKVGGDAGAVYAVAQSKGTSCVRTTWKTGCHVRSAGDLSRRYLLSFIIVVFSYYRRERQAHFVPRLVQFVVQRAVMLCRECLGPLKNTNGGATPQP